MAKILLDNEEESTEGKDQNPEVADAESSIPDSADKQEEEKEMSIPKKPVPNLFLGRSDEDADYSKFPDWDIVPPNQLINPRIKDNK